MTTNNRTIITLHELLNAISCMFCIYCSIHNSFILDEFLNFVAFRKLHTCQWFVLKKTKQY